MGPQGGDELNLIEQGRNYGWPKVSNGSHYGGADIADHALATGSRRPRCGGTVHLAGQPDDLPLGAQFPQRQGDAFIGALSGEAPIRVDIDGTAAAKGDQWGFGARIRAVDQAPDGSIWLLTDGSDGRPLRLTPARRASNGA